MEELDVNQYDKVIEPLKSVKINTLFAQTVINGKIPGSVYVDSVTEPKVFYIVHPYGMSLLFGYTDNETFNSELVQYLINKKKVRKKAEWLQVYPNSWSDKLKTLLGPELLNKDSAGNNIVLATDGHGKVVEYTRVNFNFNIDEYSKVKEQLNRPPYEIVRTTGEMFLEMQGTVIPKYFWRDDYQFQNEGIGYSVICDREVAATAFSAYIQDNKLEIGIETLEKYKGRGLAILVASALIDYCLENGFEPVWGCRLENTASYKLAQKLGFVPTINIPYYHLQV